MNIYIYTRRIKNKAGDKIEIYSQTSAIGEPKGT